MILLLNRVFFLVVLFLFVAVPSAIFVVPKVVVLVTAFLFVLVLFVLRQPKLDRSDVVWFFSAVLFLLFWLSVSLIHNQGSPDVILRAFISYLSVFALFVLLSLYYKLDIVRYTVLLELFVVALCAYVSIKIFVMFLPLLGILSLSEVSELLSGSVLAEYRSEEQQFLRIATSNDLMLPYGAFFILYAHSLGLIQKWRFMRFLMFTVILMGVFLTFTRYVWAATTFVVMAYLVSTMSVRLIAGIALSMLVFVSVLLSFDLDGVATEAFVRLSDSSSIDVKFQQADVLLEEFAGYPLFGVGLGGYVESYVRSDDLPFIYEAQWVSFLMQFGLVGVTLIVLYLTMPMWKVVGKRVNRTDLVFVVSYLLFLVSGLTNPNLTPLNVAVIYFLSYTFMAYRSGLSHGK